MIGEAAKKSLAEGHMVIFARVHTARESLEAIIVINAKRANERQV